MLKISSYYGITHHLSDEVYEVTGISSKFQPYPIGTKVRLIQCCEREKPGHHFSKGFVTTCDVNSKKAEFVGIKRNNLKKIKKWL